MAVVDHVPPIAAPSGTAQHGCTKRPAPTEAEPRDTARRGTVERHSPQRSAPRTQPAQRGTACHGKEDVAKGLPGAGESLLSFRSA
jgi:hypothetical protein